ncbi:uncharacterized protein LOC129808542 [Phlebotomus papatasi]|uniref:uncharacterized protein LOC129808542 n=1 Tax=Phlebotomus papatasi TaxID=29031 RepID=UPI0024839AAC|nr:uncharacterized protein LOC129808542 [Phlebotomus papatasi]
MKCSVPQCTSGNEKVPNKCTFHKLPKDRILAAKWVKLLSLKVNSKNYKSIRICSAHFAAEDYYKATKIYLLRKGSIPMPQNLEDNNDNEEDDADEEIEMDYEEIHEEKNGMQDSGIAEVQSYCNVNYSLNMDDFNDGGGFLASTINHDHNYVQRHPAEKIDSMDVDPDVEMEIPEIPSINPETFKSLKRLQTKCKRQSNSLMNAKEVIKELRQKNLLNEETMEKLDTLTEFQKELLNLTLNKKRSKQISPAMKKFALNLNYYGPQGYNYVRKELGQMLPHSSTIARWYKSVDSAPGFSSEALKAIQNAQEFANHQLFVHLSFDEMSIRKQSEWVRGKRYGHADFGNGDNREEELASEMLVFLVTCINAGWKIPLGYFPCHRPSGEQKANLLKMAITNLQETKVRLTGVTCDGAPTNLSALRILGCHWAYPSTKTTFTVSNNSQENLAFYPDPVHMIKLVRTAIAETGPFVNGKGEKIDWVFMQRLVELQEKEGLHAATKIRRAHIEFRRQKMKVRQTKPTNIINSTNRSLTDDQENNVEAFEEFCALNMLEHILTLPELSPYNQKVTQYIGGFVTRSLQNALKCEECIESLEGSSNSNSLICVFLAEESGPTPEKKKRERNIPASDPFDIPDQRFVKLYRLNKSLVRELIMELIPFMKAPSRASSLDPKTRDVRKDKKLLIFPQIFAVLRFFASGSYQLDIACNKFTPMSQSSFSRSLHEVLNAMEASGLAKEIIKFPRSIEELNEARRDFFQEYGFPGVVGCIDCTHVAIIAPTDSATHPEHVYINRKLYHSVNVQLICDVKLRIINVNARYLYLLLLYIYYNTIVVYYIITDKIRKSSRSCLKLISFLSFLRYPGSTHDSFIWNHSSVKPFMENLHKDHPNEYHLLGDSGYALRPWMMTPFGNPASNSPEERFNNYQTATRSIIERVNGILKSRFLCLLRHRVLHYDPTTVSRIITTCCILHNMCVNANMEFVADDEDDDVDFGIIDPDPIPNTSETRRGNWALAEGRCKQQNIVENYFSY